MGAKSKGRSWTHDELLVVCNLYITLPFGQMHSRNPTVVSLARALGRTPGSIAMKLVNFASLDPVHKARGVSGLSGVAKADRAVWEEFHSNWAGSASNSEKRLQDLLGVQQRAIIRGKTDQRLEELANRPTETLANVKVRTMQSFFRRAVLAAYEGKCCITGNTAVELLVASHILPWSQFPNQRTNPRNGLCLAAHFDKAFDLGLITLGTDITLVVSSRLRAYLPNDALEREFVSREGSQVTMPDRFPPDPEFLAYHRRNVFQG